MHMVFYSVYLAQSYINYNLNAKWVIAKLHPLLTNKV